MPIIYKATLPDGRCYIGKTTGTLAIRRTQHEAAARNRFRNALAEVAAKGKLDDVRWEVVERTNASDNALLEREAAAVIANNALFPAGLNTHMPIGKRPHPAPPDGARSKSKSSPLPRSAAARDAALRADRMRRSEAGRKGAAIAAAKRKSTGGGQP